MKNMEIDYLVVSAASVIENFAKGIEAKKEGRTTWGTPESFFDPVKEVFIFKVITVDKD